MVHSDFTAAFTPGTRFADDDGDVIEVSPRVIGELDVPSGRLCVCDPLTSSFEELAPLAREAPTGTFPVEVAIARMANGDLRVACARVRFDAATQATTWEPALVEGQPPPGEDEVPGYGVDAGMGSFLDAVARASFDEATTDAWLAALERNSVDTWTSHVAGIGKANVVMCSSGWGDGFYASWWGLSAEGHVVELVTDFEVLLGPVRETFELQLPLASGAVKHPLLVKHGVTLKAPLLSKNTLVAGGEGSVRIKLSDETPVQMTPKRAERRYSWQKPAPGVRLLVSVFGGLRPLDVLPSR